MLKHYFEQNSICKSQTFREISICFAEHAIAKSILTQYHKFIFSPLLQIVNCHLHLEIIEILIASDRRFRYHTHCSPFGSIGQAIPHHILEIWTNIA